ncbi:type II toxin-antitoxin system RelE/ParE family toxin [Stutzerimonas degradans]|uniref:type II toxin-antitoxin system RelE/ParE family toxin n=1 Tax=Stutzerimonas degradans TaxID=2968968 RepID=UPI0013F4DAD1|nr:type II toxin-antitoxin system RelE/ParE family toxin [Stutzerimonas degradans]NHC12155.1 type II toxin-antitoxin system RelE/ParE family toxin [Stutzerimonas degradans]
MKQKPVIPRALAREDVDRAIAYYLEQEADKAALGLIDVLEHAYKQLSRHPETGSNRYAYELDLPGLRSWPLKRYPYVVFYVEQADYIEVWRVLHDTCDIPARLKLNAQ